MLFRSLFLLFAWFCMQLAAEGGTLNDEIRSRTEQIRSGSSLTVEGETVSSVIVLPALYERRDFKPLWTKPMAIDQLFTAIDSIDADGLDSRDYHPAVLNALRQRLTDSAQNTTSLTADYDILLTDSLIRLGYHLLAGKVDPEKLDANWNMSQSIGDLDTLLEMADAIETARVLQLLDQLRPQHPSRVAGNPFPMAPL
jgi:murein L,D-transpeptidase YcbB/YkuD